MKGLIFAEFLEMVEVKYGYDVTDRILEKVDSVNDGVFNQGTNYDPQELIRMVDSLSREVNLTVPGVMRMFGEHLFNRFVILYRPIFAGKGDVFEFLEELDENIHSSVMRVLPDAEFPRIKTKRVDDNTMEILYRSPRGMSDLAVGLINGCKRYFNEEVALNKEYLSTDGSIVKITLSKN